MTTLSPSPSADDIHSLPLLHRGKVRDIYGVGEDKLLIVASDRISAFDVILDDRIPGKGKVLTALTHFWLAKLAHIVPNHATNIAPEDVVTENEREKVRDRAMVVKRLTPIPIEAVERGYLSGSGWQAYQATGQLCGLTLPPGLQLASRLPQPIFTPAAKAPVGDHDENVDFEYVVHQVGLKMAERIRAVTHRLYTEASTYAASKGIIIADTKFEFGCDADGTLYLMDEVLTPDSSRFWPIDQYQPGIPPPSFDKQFVRDWLATQSWDKTPPAPRLPADILRKTEEKYLEAQRLLTA